MASSIIFQLVGVATQCLFLVGGCGYAVSCSQLVGVATVCSQLMGVATQCLFSVDGCGYAVSFLSW